MSVRLLFPTYLFEFNLVEEGLVTEEYLLSLKNDMDAVRKTQSVDKYLTHIQVGNQMMASKIAPPGLNSTV